MFSESSALRSSNVPSGTRTSDAPTAERLNPDTAGSRQANDRVTRSTAERTIPAPAEWTSRPATFDEASSTGKGPSQRNHPSVAEHMESAPLDRDKRLKHITKLRVKLERERDWTNPSASRSAAIEQDLRQLSLHLRDADHGRYPGAFYTQASREHEERLRASFAQSGITFAENARGFIPKDYQGKEAPTPQAERTAEAGASTSTKGRKQKLREIPGIAAGTPRQTLHEGSRYIEAETTSDKNGGKIVLHRARVEINAHNTSPGFQKYAGMKLASFSPTTKTLIFKQSDPSYRRGRNPVDLSESEVALVNGYGYQLPGMTA